jgi:hypothetical protein
MSSNLTFSAEVILSRFKADAPQAGGVIPEKDFISFVGGDEGLVKGKKQLIENGLVKEIDGKSLELTAAGAERIAGRTKH